MSMNEIEELNVEDTEHVSGGPLFTPLVIAAADGFIKGVGAVAAVLGIAIGIDHLASDDDESQASS